ncbi:MAG: 50S ribosomal protein L11 methyltransferase [Chloroflexi bacterium]|nr:50S ribosomal protein L11 methyltransferase [Chloroflexota bacterium]
MPPSPPGDAPPSGDAWIELSLRLPAADAEIVADVLATLAPGGASVDAPFRNVEPERFGLELTGDEATVRAFFPAPLATAERRAVRRRLTALPLGAPLPRLRYSEVDESDWAEEWKRFYHPMRVGRLLVQPSWEEAADVGPEDLVVTLDPGRAFGTGQHETTRLCLAALDRLVRPGDAVLDVGTGSGILALAAARLGASRVDALDTDPVAVAATRENAARNGLGDRIEVAEGSLGAAWPWEGEARGGYDVVVMNIALVVVTELLPDAAAALRPGGALVASGFLAGAAPEVEAAVRAAGLGAVSSEFDGEWGAVTARA